MLNQRYKTTRKWHSHCPFPKEIETGTTITSMKIEIRVGRDIIRNHRIMEQKFKEQFASLWSVDEIIRMATNENPTHEEALAKTGKILSLVRKIRFKYKEMIESPVIDAKDIARLPESIIKYIGEFQSHLDYGIMSRVSTDWHLILKKPCHIQLLDLSKVNESVICSVRPELFPKTTEIIIPLGISAECYVLKNAPFWEKIRRLRFTYSPEISRRCAFIQESIVDEFTDRSLPALTHVYVDERALTHISTKLLYRLWSSLASLKSIRFGCSPPGVVWHFAENMPKFLNLEEFEVQLSAITGFNGFPDVIIWFNQIRFTVQRLYISVMMAVRPFGGFLNSEYTQSQIQGFPELKYLRWTGTHFGTDSGTLIGILQRSPKLESVMIEVATSWSVAFIQKVLIILLQSPKMKEITMCVSFTKLPTNLVDGIMDAFSGLRGQTIKPKLTFVVDHFVRGKISEEQTARNISDILKVMHEQECCWGHCVEFEYSNTALLLDPPTQEMESSDEESDEDKDDEDMESGNDEEEDEEEDEDVDEDVDVDVDVEQDEDYKGILWGLLQTMLPPEFPITHDLRSNPMERKGNCCSRRADWVNKECPQCHHECSYTTITYKGEQAKK